MKIILAPAFIFCTVSAENAMCAPEENLYLSCELRDWNTEVSVCFDDDTTYYRYGEVNKQPQLELSEPLDKLDYVPSTRNGQFVWDEVEFRNAQYRYRITVGFLIPWEDVPKEEFAPAARFGDTTFGEISVSQNDKIISELQCRFENIEFNQKRMIEMMQIENVRIWEPWVPPDDQ
jgi:hypothetical protein